MPRSLFSIALLLGAVSLPALPAGVPAPVETTPSRTNEESTSVAAPAPPTAIVEVIDAVAPWVVAIKVERTKDVDGPRVNNRRLTREAREYFDRPNEEVTGVLVHPRGEIVTSAYNVAGEISEITVYLPDGSERKARRVAVSELDDLALLALEGDEPAVAEEDWREVPWAEGQTRTGTFVFAVGRSPDPKHLTVTEGIISASGRNGNRSLQTDAKLNYGNVGGPLVDLEGRIVGITGSVGHIYPQWGLNSGIGLATNAATVRALVEELRKGKDYELPPPAFLGVQADTERPPPVGARVDNVITGSSADKGGVRAGDVIRTVDDIEIQSFQHLRRLLFLKKVGDTIRLKVERDGQEIDLEVNLGERPDL